MIVPANNGHATHSLVTPVGSDRTARKMASNLDFAEDIEEAKAYMAKKNVFQLFEVRKYFHSACFGTICYAEVYIGPELCI